MRAVDASVILHNLRVELSEFREPVELLKITASHAGRFLNCDSVLVRYKSSEVYLESDNIPIGNRSRPSEIFNYRDGCVRFEHNQLTLPFVVHDLSRSRLIPDLASVLKKHQIFSIAVIPLLRGREICGWMECRFVNRYHRWRKEDLLVLQQMADYCLLFLDSCPEMKQSAGLPYRFAVGEEAHFSRQLDQARQEYSRLVEYSNLLTIRTNREFVVTDVVGNTREILGVTPQELLDDPQVWRKFLHSRDLKNLWRRVAGMRLRPTDLSEEIRVINRETSQVRWLMLRGVPLYSPQNEFLGWEGVGVDITEKRLAQDELENQSKRIEALYEVSRALQVNMEPALVTLRGLRALINATNSDCGLGCFYDRDNDSFEIVASEGVSPNYIEGLSTVLNGQSVVRVAVQNREGYLIHNLQEDKRAAVHLARQEGIKSTIVMPLIFEDTVLGCLAIFCREANRYKEEDYDLVLAACSQISLAARQAELYAIERKQASSLATLYRLSHELSKYFTPREVAEHAFPVINQEVACKRMWLGVMNEQNTHIVGQAGFGPNMGANIVKVQVEMDLRHDFLDDALKRKQPVIVQEGQAVECSGLNRIMKILNPGTFVIVPLISLGQVVGILVVEPEVNSPRYAESKLALLTSMASEIAMVILARRFEARMADADKMRMAGMMASGVAHNFNNLLQAVMGQASLIEMQLPANSPLVGSARMIIDAANRGASLINHLLNFSSKETRARKHINVSKMLNDSSDFYRSILGSEVALEISAIDEDLPQIYGDYSQLQQAITNLLVNSREAILVRQQRDGRVKVSARKVRVATGEIDAEMAPGHYIRIDVEDNGAGMDSERLTRCFEPFFTTKNADSQTGVGVGGSGLGLSSAYSIIRQHDGIICAASQPSQGSTFTIYLPMIISHLKGAISAADSQLPLETVEVLTLALDEAVGSSVRSFMYSHGLRTYLAQKRVEAVQILKANARSIRLVVLDVDKWGAESMSFIRGLLLENPEVVLAALTDQLKKWSDLLADLPGVKTIEKPLSIWSLHSVIKLIEGESDHSGAESLAEQVDVQLVDEDRDFHGADNEHPLEDEAAG